MQKAFVVCFVILIAMNCVTSRWLPTRSQEDRLDKLREMLKDLLESEIERSNYESKNIFKREVGTQLETIQTAEDTAHKEKQLYSFTDPLFGLVINCKFFSGGFNNLKNNGLGFSTAAIKSSLKK